MEPIERLRGITKYLRTEVNSELPIQHLAILIEVARKDGITMPEISVNLNMPSGSLSRNIKILSRYMEKNEMKGYDLVEVRDGGVINGSVQAREVLLHGLQIAGWPKNLSVNWQEDQSRSLD